MERMVLDEKKAIAKLGKKKEKEKAELGPKGKDGPGKAAFTQQRSSLSPISTALERFGLPIQFRSEVEGWFTQINWIPNVLRS